MGAGIGVQLSRQAGCKSTLAIGSSATCSQSGGPPTTYQSLPDRPCTAHSPVEQCIRPLTESSLVAGAGDQDRGVSLLSSGDASRPRGESGSQAVVKEGRVGARVSGLNWLSNTV